MRIIARVCRTSWTPPCAAFGFHGLHNLGRHLPAREVDEIWAIIPASQLADPKLIWAAKWLMDLRRFEEARDFLARLIRVSDSRVARELLQLATGLHSG